MSTYTQIYVQSTAILTAHYHIFNPLIATLKPQSNGPSHSNTVIGTMAVDGWAVTTFSTAMRGLGGAIARPGPSSRYPSTTSVPTSYYSMWYYNWLWSLKG